MENFLVEINKEIKIYQKIKKGIKILEKKENKNMFKTFSYISKIDENLKEMNNLFKKLIKNLKISYNEDQSNIKYQEYYFNGIQIPEDIIVCKGRDNSLEISWKIKDVNIINIDNKNIRFRVELRKENKNDKFFKVYEGNKNYCLIDNFYIDINTNYEIRVCCVYYNLVGFWSYFCDSKILEESKKKNEFLDKIYSWTNFKKMKLLYRGSRDGTKSSNFHEKCDNQSPTLCLYKNDKGYIFGGYSSISWSSDGKWEDSRNNFLFTLTNIHGTEPAIFPIINYIYGTYNSLKYGPIFGYVDIGIYDDYINSICECEFPKSYKDTLNKGKSIFTGNLDNNNTKMKIIEIEVFKLYD